MAALAGAIVLATLGTAVSTSAEAQTAQDSVGTVITNHHIARFRAALHLTAAQKPYWAPVESAMHEIARAQARESTGSFTQRVSSRVIAITLTANAARKLMSAAGPLLRTLDEGQKLEAMRLARSMGFDQYVSNF
jgi:hypothetical protein